MSEDPRLVSISSNTSLNPEEIARRTFPAARKGVDAEAVRRYLESVADDVRSLLEREAQMRRRVAEAERKAAEPPVLDEATLNRAVGAETARVLQTAHEAASEVVSRAEARAAELVSDAEARADELVREAEAHAAERLAAAEEESTAALESATEEASALTGAAEAEATALSEAAHAEAEELIEAAQDEASALSDTTRQQCRQAVREARRLRKSILSDLTARRHALFVQLEQLRSGRDTLVEVVDTVGESVDLLRERLANAEHDARLAAAEAGDRAEQVTEEEVDTLLEPEIALQLRGELLGDLEAEFEEEFEEELEDELEAAAEAELEASFEVEGAHEVEEPGGILEAAGGLAEQEYTSAEDEFDESEAEGDSGTGTQREAGSARRSVDELFARIRASRSRDSAAAAQAIAQAGEVDAAAGEAGAAEAADVVGAGGTAEAGAVEAATEAEAAEIKSDEADLESAALEVAGEPEGLETTLGTDGADAASAVSLAGTESSEGAKTSDAAALARRNEVLAPVMTRLSRALKRALQDDQNELLTAMRNASGVPVLETLLPEDEQRARYAQAAAGVLADGWLLGRSWLRAPEGADESEDGKVGDSAADAGKSLGNELAEELAGLIRHRLGESLVALGELGDGAQDAAGGAYREWKGPRVEGIAGDFATRAFAGGAVAAAGGAIVRWVVDDDGRPCPDCDDNALAGDQFAGDEWPTGQLHPPVHPGCRCLLVNSH
ncbi:MAG TPA: DivIVA domain-containing protein [Acidimicrobiales bacterium]|nr:DivIVA domain-containing protein [Acidimicrobiales bacterium]